MRMLTLIISKILENKLLAVNHLIILILAYFLTKYRHTGTDQYLKLSKKVQKELIETNKINPIFEHKLHKLKKLSMNFMHKNMPQITKDQITRLKQCWKNFQ